MKKEWFRGWKILVFCMVLSCSGILIGFGSIKTVMAVTKSRFEKLELFNKVLFLVESQYYKEVDTRKLIEGAIEGMLNTLDPHSAFLDKELFQKMQEDTKGEFGGLGIEVTQKDGVIIVITAIDDTPAYKAGLKSGDKIVEINHESIVGMPLEKAVEKMKGLPDTKITVGIIRKGIDGVKQFEVMRKIIKSKPVKSFLVDDNFIFVRLTQFQKDSAKYVIEGIKKIRGKLKEKDKVKGIILDLRSNPGGLLDEAVSVSSIFLKDGVVVSTEGRNKTNKEIKYVTKLGYKELELPLVVLINGASASASEIVAGALQDYKRAIIMGVRSFGKGSVQTVAKIDDESGVKLTIAQYMTPSGRKIQAIGIKPDVLLTAGQMNEDTEERRYIREIDLRNHLSAAIETPEEQKFREEKEREEQLLKIKRFEKSKEGGKNKKNKDDKVDRDDDLFKKYDPNDDPEVLQAINYLKSFDIFKKLVK